MYFLCKYSGLRIDRRNGIQMERDVKNRFSGTAIVAFKNAEDYGMAIKTDLQSVSPLVKNKIIV